MLMRASTSLTFLTRYCNLNFIPLLIVESNVIEYLIFELFYLLNDKE